MMKGRGTAGNPAGRFEVICYESDDGLFHDLPPADKVRNVYMRDDSKDIISKNDSPDVHFAYTVNPYRGCEHGCIYCYARPYHEYLGFSAGLDFESRIMVKDNAAACLEKAFQKKSWQGDAIGFSGATDPYQPIERKLEITRSCLQVAAAFRNPIGIVTKNDMLLRDLDIFEELQAFQGISVAISITTLDEGLRRKMEPRTVTAVKRLEAARVLSDAGIPVTLLLAPVIPGLNDEEIPEILEAAADAGIRHAHYIMLRLPYGVKELFSDWLADHYPNRQQRVLDRVKACRGGELYDSDFSQRMTGEGIFAEQIAQLFELSCKRHGFNQREHAPLNSKAFHRHDPRQPWLF